MTKYQSRPLGLGALYQNKKKSIRYYQDNLQEPPTEHERVAFNNYLNIIYLILILYE